MPMYKKLSEVAVRTFQIKNECVSMAIGQSLFSLRVLSRGQQNPVQLWRGTDEGYSVGHRPSGRALLWSDRKGTASEGGAGLPGGAPVTASRGRSVISAKAASKAGCRPTALRLSLPAVFMVPLFPVTISLLGSPGFRGGWWRASASRR